MEPAVFLDRDNTLIANDGDLGDPGAVRLLDGVASGLKALDEAGYRLVVITNQGGVARGRYDEASVDAVHRRIAELVDEISGGRHLIDRFYYCPYHPEGRVEAYRREHPWRKPAPGMILQAALDLDLDLAGSWMIGDQPRDVAAGQSAGCRTVLLGADGGSDAKPTASVETFSEAVHHVLRHTRRPTRRRTGGLPRPRPATPAPEAAAKPARPEPREENDANAELRRAIGQLGDELRAQRLAGSEFTGFKLVASLTQLVVLLLATLGLMQMDRTEVFMKWMIGAVLLQLGVVTLLLFDGRE